VPRSENQEHKENWAACQHQLKLAIKLLKIHIYSPIWTAGYLAMIRDRRARESE
jgi:hypothetical protein